MMKQQDEEFAAAQKVLRENQAKVSNLDSVISRLEQDIDDIKQQTQQSEDCVILKLAEFEAIFKEVFGDSIWIAMLREELKSDTTQKSNIMNRYMSRASKLLMNKEEEEVQAMTKMRQYHWKCRCGFINSPNCIKCELCSSRFGAYD